MVISDRQTAPCLPGFRIGVVWYRYGVVWYDVVLVWPKELPYLAACSTEPTQ